MHWKFITAFIESLVAEKPICLSQESSLVLLAKCHVTREYKRQKHREHRQALFSIMLMVMAAQEKLVLLVKKKKKHL